MKKDYSGISQINNCFSGAYYLPYVAGLLESYFKVHKKKKIINFRTIIQKNKCAGCSKV